MDPHRTKFFLPDMPTPATPDFSITFARSRLSDLFTPRPWIYWLDFGFSYGVGMFCFQQVRGGSLLQPHRFQGTAQEWICFCVSCLLFYRAAMFIHEVVHQRANEDLASFRFVWNLLCGIPFLTPSFVYYSHIDHHRRKHFGTRDDGEYMPLYHRPRWQILFYLSWPLIIPILVFLRFLVLTPLAWLIPGVRHLVHRHASSLVMDPTYIRPLPNESTRQLIHLQEVGCFLWCLGIISYAPLNFGHLPIPFLVHAYCTSVVIVFLNSVRTLGSHRWTNAGQEMTFVEQLLDSVNYPRHAWLSELWGPVGTRFHALHHLFPSLPISSLPFASCRSSSIAEHAAH